MNRPTFAATIHALTLTHPTRGPLHTPGKGGVAHGSAAGHTKGGVGAKHPPAAAGMAPTDPFADVGTEPDGGEADILDPDDAVDETGTSRIVD